MKNLLFPCCKIDLPAPLDGVALATCVCGLSYLPNTIIEWNDMRSIITGWRDVISKEKAQIICVKGEELFIAELIRQGLKYVDD